MMFLIVDVNLKHKIRFNCCLNIQQTKNKILIDFGIVDVWCNQQKPFLKTGNELECRIKKG